MRILSKYLLKQHLVPFVFAVSALTAFQLLNQIARQFGNLVGKGLPWSVIAEVFVLSIPFIVTTTLSMAVLMAVLYAVGRLTADHEIVAMRAGGISMGRLIVPLLAAASLVAVLSFLFSDQVLPRSNHRLRTLMTDIGRKKPTFSLKEQVINEVQRNRFYLRAARINQSTFALRDVTIYDLGDQLRKRIIYADSGYMALSPDQETLYLTLYDGVTHEVDRTDPHSFQQIEFRKDVIRVSGVGNVLTRTTQDNFKGDREMGVCEMESVIRTADHEAIQYRARERGARLNAVRALVGLAPITPDTAAPTRDYSPYCRPTPRRNSPGRPRDARPPPAAGRSSARRPSHPTA
jgi:lipopolysaccharide export system permease protein